MDNLINILTIDPGNNIGVSIITVDVRDFSIVNIETRLYVLENLIPVMDDNFNKLLYKLSVIQDIVTDLYVAYNPIALGVETSFLNTRFPKAVLQLSQYVAVIEHTMYTLNTRIKMFRYMPRYIKRILGAGGSADKDDMMVTMSAIDELTNHINPYILSEHEVDAIAIGYTVLMEIREFPYILYTL
jgi:Holliday junction resolvasome RuvABC endonuclease subunit